MYLFETPAFCRNKDELDDVMDLRTNSKRNGDCFFIDDVFQTIEYRSACNTINSSRVGLAQKDITSRGQNTIFVEGASVFPFGKVSAIFAYLGKSDSFSL